MKLRIKQQKTNKTWRDVDMRDLTCINRYDKAIPSWSKMCRLLAKTI